jgi:shikimate dehydrogenase
MKIDPKTRLLGLFGNPAGHSLSPLVHNLLIDYYGLNYIYLSFEPDIKNLKNAFNAAKNLDFKGLNITMPFKEEIMDHIQKLSLTSSVIGSANTIRFEYPEKISHGHSTDGDGVVKSLEEKGFEWKNKNCLILGAGGAAKSAIFSIINKPVKQIFLYNVRKKRAIDLVENFKINIKNIIKKGINNKNNKNLLKIPDNKIIENKIVLVSDINKIGNKLDVIDLIINCTPLGMDLKDLKDLLPLPENWVLKNKFVFDMVYKPLETALLKKAKREKAASLINGIDMLINQGAYSFKFWFGIMPEEKVIKKAKEKIKKHLSQQ